MLAFFRSIPFFIACSIALGIPVIIGIVVPQDQSLQYYYRIFGPTIGSLIPALGWNRIFYSLWFFIPLVAFTINLILCLVQRAAFFIKTVSRQTKFDDCSEASPIETITLQESSSDAAVEKLKALLHKKRYTCIFSQYEGSIVDCSAKKGITGLAGSLLLHGGLLLLLAGGIFNYYKNETFRALLTLNKEARIPMLGITVSARTIQKELNEKGALANYATTLSVSDTHGSPLIHGTTRVNSPVRYNDIYFYQSEYGLLPDSIESIHASIIAAASAETLFTGTIPFAQKFPLGKNNLTILCTRFIPDFKIDLGSREVYSESPLHNNPALNVTVLQNDSVVDRQWVFLHPMMSRMMTRRTVFSIIADRYTPIVYSGILVKKKPETPFIVLGIVVVTIGLFLSLYVPFRTLYIRIRETEGVCAVTVYSHKASPNEWCIRECRAITTLLTERDQCSI